MEMSAKDKLALDLLEIAGWVHCGQYGDPPDAWGIRIDLDARIRSYASRADLEVALRDYATRTAKPVPLSVMALSDAEASLGKGESAVRKLTKESCPRCGRLVKVVDIGSVAPPWLNPHLTKRHGPACSGSLLPTRAAREQYGELLRRTSP